MKGPVALFLWKALRPSSPPTIITEVRKWKAAIKLLYNFQNEKTDIIKNYYLTKRG